MKHYHMISISYFYVLLRRTQGNYLLYFYKNDTFISNPNDMHSKRDFIYCKSNFMAFLFIFLLHTMRWRISHYAKMEFQWGNWNCNELYCRRNVKYGILVQWDTLICVFWNSASLTFFGSFQSLSCCFFMHSNV
jgi:hypothetical protein